MPKRLSSKRYVVGGCTSTCSLNEAALGPHWSKTLHAWYEEGMNDFLMEERARGQGLNVSHGAIGRHRKNHLIEADSVQEDESMAELDDVSALEAILKQGQKQIKSWKVTPSEYFKAMELKYRLTQGSTNDAMFAALAGVGAEEDEDTGPEEVDGTLEDPE